MWPWGPAGGTCCGATANAQGLSHGFAPASAATAAATALESTNTTRSDAARVARSLLVAAATIAVSPGWSTLACSPSNRRLTTAILGACAARRDGRTTVEQNSQTKTTPPARTRASGSWDRAKECNLEVPREIGRASCRERV